MGGLGGDVDWGDGGVVVWVGFGDEECRDGDVNPCWGRRGHDEKDSL